MCGQGTYIIEQTQKSNKTVMEMSFVLASIVPDKLWT